MKLSRSALVVGCGNLGRRHVQSLYSSGLFDEIDVVEPSIKNFVTCEQALEKSFTALRRLTEISSVRPRYDFVVFSTTANQRLLTIKEFFENSSSDYILAEKLVFNSVKDFDDFDSFSKQFGIDTSLIYINLPRRFSSFYRLLKAKLSSLEVSSIELKGTGWGLGSNALHFLDIFAWILDESGFASISFEVAGIKQSSRTDYVEVFGYLTAETIRGISVRLVDVPDVYKDLSVSIYTSDGVIEINESDGVANIFGAVYPVDIELQSRLTATTYENIRSGDEITVLPTYPEIVELHRKLIFEFQKVEGLRNSNGGVLLT